MIKLLINNFQIIKPNLVLMNLISMVSGYLSAHKIYDNNQEYKILIVNLLGMSLIISASCIFNNIIDRFIDQKMQRTKYRALANGYVSLKLTYVIASTLTISGFLILFLNDNLISFGIAVLGFVIYVIVYSLYLKSRSIYSTLIGSIAGAVPPAIGYCTATNRLDLTILVIVTIFILWQIPHFYSIVMLNFNDYQSANIPTLPTIKGKKLAYFHSILCILFLVIFIIIFDIVHFIKFNYLITTTILSSIWIFIICRSFNSNNFKSWNYKSFILSILTVINIDIMLIN